jgi:hypothetical protein
LPRERVWALWQYLQLENAFRPDWVEPRSAPPIVTVSCKSRYTKPQIAALLHTIRHTLAEGLSCEADKVFVGVHRFQPGELCVRGEIWDDSPSWQDEQRLRPIGVVRCSRRDPTDDDWGDVTAVIELDHNRLSCESVQGLSDFSHLEVVFVLHRVREEEVETGACLRKAQGLRREWAKAQREAGERQRQRRPQAVAEGQARLRANLREVPQPSPLHQRYLDKFNKQGDEVEKYRAEAQKLQGQEHAQKKALDEFLAAFSAE